MKRTVLTQMMLCATIAVQAQINNGAHWYDGEITFTATTIEHNNVLMKAMDEGEEHEFVLRYSKEVNPNVLKQITSGERVLIKHLYHDPREICDYGKLVAAFNIMPRAENSFGFFRRLLILPYQVTIPKTEIDRQLAAKLKAELLSFNGIIYPYDIITFNGRVTGYITIKPVEGSANELEGTWEVVPTLKGFHLYSVNTETGSTPWEWQRSGVEYELVESNPDVGRFFFASNMLLNDCQFRRFDKSTLRIMRNAILARHGYRFQSKDLQDYFALEPWYKPASSNDGIRLSFIEQLNIELIKQMEEKD